MVRALTYESDVLGSYLGHAFKVENTNLKMSTLSDPAGH